MPRLQYFLQPCNKYINGIKCPNEGAIEFTIDIKVGGKYHSTEEMFCCKDCWIKLWSKGGQIQRVLYNYKNYFE